MVGPFCTVPVQLFEDLYPVHVNSNVTPEGEETTSTWLSAKVVCAVRVVGFPFASSGPGSVAVTKNVTPTSSASGAKAVLMKVPSLATVAVSAGGWSISGLSAIAMETVPPGSQQDPVKVTVEPGAYSCRSVWMVGTQVPSP